MKKSSSLFALILLASALSLAAAEVLRNNDVIRMVKAGLSAATIEEKIKTSDSSFVTDTDALIDLKEAKVPDSVIKLMIARDGKSRTAEPPAPPPPSRRSKSSIPTREFDVYLETSNWNTCAGTLTIDQDGMRGTGCAKRSLNFDVEWRDIRSFCYEFAFYDTMYIRTEKKSYRVSSNDGKGVKRVKELLERYQPDIEELEECR